MLIIRFHNFPCDSIHFKFILNTISRKFQLIYAIIQFIVPLRELCFFQAQLFQNQLFSLFQTDISITCIIFFFYSHSGRRKLMKFYSTANTFGYFLQKVIVWIAGTLFQLNNNIFGMSVNGFFEIPILINFFYQLTDYRMTLLAFISGILAYYFFSIIVFPIDFQNLSIIVIRNFNFRIHTQQDSPCSLGRQGFSRLGSSSL